MKHSRQPNAARQKLLTAAQRRALEARVRSHAQSLKTQIHATVTAEAEPEGITKARELVENYEDGQAKRIDQLQSGIHRAMKQVVSNLLFDTVESCLIQVEEFEERKVI